MFGTIATSLNGQFEIISNGNYSFWVRRRGVSKYRAAKEFAGRTMEDALTALEARGY
jgi:hypothetical protein